MTVRTSSLATLTPQQIAAWQDLAAHAVAPNVWLEPGFVIDAAAQWPGGDDLVLIYDEDASGQWSSLVLWGHEPYAVHGRQIATASAHTPYLATFSPRAHPLVRAGDAHASLARILDSLGRGGLPGAMALDKIPGGPLLDALRSAAREVGAAMVEHDRGQMRFAPAHPNASWSFGPARQAEPSDAPLTKDYLRRLRRLSRGADLPVETADWAQRADLVETFAEFQSRGWKGDPMRGGDGLALHAERKEAFARIVDRFAREGRLRAITLHADGEPLYLSICLGSAAGRAFGIYDAYDERYARFGAGIIGRLATILSHTNGPHGVDFDPSIDPEVPQPKELFATHVPAHAVLVVRRGAGDRALLRAARLASRARHRRVR